MDFLLLLIGLLVGGALGALVMHVVASRRPGDAVEPVEDPALVEARHERALLELRASAEAERAALLAEQHEQQAMLRAELAAAEAAAAGLREQLEHQVRQHREALEQQRLDQAERSERERRESAVLQALSPVRETLATMQRKVSELEQQRSEQYGSIAEQLKRAQLSDAELRATTESLASALRNNSTRGVWGETQLRRVVEAAGLTQHVDFELQTQVTTDQGRGRPDMVVNLPGGKYIPLDSKVPLEHYLEASSIPETATGEEGARRKSLIDRHVKAMRSHIDALGKKSYWEGLAASPEFVIAFIPNESLLSAALEADAGLLNYAFERRVALASPVNLFAVLKTIDYAWQQQAVSDEAKKLFDLGNTLYQRIGVLAGHADSLRKAIERTVDSYNKFASSLESRVLVTARQFPGINETKLSLVAEPTPIHESPRRLSAPELTDGDAVAGLPAADPTPADATPGSEPIGAVPVSDEPVELIVGTDFDGADLDPHIRSASS
ncbi:DNA recombination protein RmuC [Agromyces sp. NDB4Y10]|uniref:DNA recombination protein RmuC n=1 Tax=Agromyces sp. NDB4Y10 TaxID=1775951 RepID=UPI0007B23272|nr:DNA recombination protein RmuC [Agromyces sp. NDB4Y10]KZE95177.1 DNA recombination protein RmuC [Agromyces sp. NDB4Y10]